MKAEELMAMIETTRNDEVIRLLQSIDSNLTTLVEAIGWLVVVYILGKCWSRVLK